MNFEEYHHEPRVVTAYCGINIGNELVTLTRAFRKILEAEGIQRVRFHYNRPQDTIMITPENDTGLKVRTQVSCLISKVMPKGRYEYTERLGTGFLLVHKQ